MSVMPAGRISSLTGIMLWKNRGEQITATCIAAISRIYAQVAAFKKTVWKSLDF